MGELEKRGFEFRLQGTEEQPVLAGYAAVFNQDSVGLPWVERIAPGAFAASLGSGQDVLATVDHDFGKVLARRSNGTLTLQEDERGLRVEITPNMDTSFGRDVVASVKRRDLIGMSFCFICKKDEWDYENDTRTILEADLREVSIVSLPAYPSAEIHKRGGKDMTALERELRQRLATLNEQQGTLLAKDELTDEERGRQLNLAKEIRSIENRLTEFKSDPKPTPALAPTHDEQRAAFVRYLRTGEARALGTGADAGGVMAPTGFIAEVLRARQEAAVMRKLARVIGPVDSAQIEIPRGLTGITAAWLTENTAIEPGDPTFDKLTFTLHKMGALTQVSNELLADSGIDVESLLAALFGEALAKLEDTAFFSGSGSGQPTGILTSTDIEDVEAEKAAEISLDDLLSLYDAVPPQYRDSASWVMNPATMSLLRKLADASGRLILQADLSGSAPNTIMGRPVYLTSNMPVVKASNKTILFGDFKQAYMLVDHRNLGVQRSADRYFEADQVAFRAIARVDGQVAIADAVRVLKHPAA